MRELNLWEISPDLFLLQFLRRRNTEGVSKCPLPDSRVRRSRRRNHLSSSSCSSLISAVTCFVWERFCYGNHRICLDMSPVTFVVSRTTTRTARRRRRIKESKGVWDYVKVKPDAKILAAGDSFLSCGSTKEIPEEREEDRQTDSNHDWTGERE